MSFRDNRALDQRNAQMKLAAAQQELADMDALHDMRDARDIQDERKPSAQSSPADDARPSDTIADVVDAGQRASSVVSTGSLPGIVAATVSVISHTDFFERAVSGEHLSLTITAEEVRKRLREDLMALQQDELARWRQIKPPQT